MRRAELPHRAAPRELVRPTSGAGGCTCIGHPVLGTAQQDVGEDSAEHLAVLRPRSIGAIASHRGRGDLRGATADQVGGVILSTAPLGTSQRRYSSVVVPITSGALGDAPADECIGGEAGTRSSSIAMA